MKPDHLGGLTPTEYLVMEVLIARYRLGVNIWPFPSQLRSALKKLESKDMAGYKSGIVEGTCDAWLSPSFRDALPEWTP